MIAVKLPDASTILARRLLRLAVVNALVNAKLVDNEKSLQSPGSWATPPEKLPALLVRAPREHKDGITPNSPPQFNSTVTIVVEGRLDAPTEEEAQDKVELLEFLVENAVMNDVPLTSAGMVQKFATVETETEVTADGRVFIGAFKKSFGLETYELFGPQPGNPLFLELQRLRLTLDMAYPFDATGTYATPAFPDSVVPAPRTTGPDGRAEGTLDIDLTQ